MSLEKIRAFMSQKAGPLPVWGWAAIILIGLLAFWWYKKAGPFSSVSSNGGSQSAPTLSDTLNGAGGGVGGTPVAPVPAQVPATVTPYQGGVADPAAAPSYVPAASASSPAPAPSVQPIYAAVTPAVSSVGNVAQSVIGAVFSPIQNLNTGSGSGTMASAGKPGLL